MPGQICAVATCTTSFYKSKRNGEEVVFFRFPKSSLQAEWVRRCFRIDPVNVNTARICSKHFLPSDFEDEIKAKIMKVVPRKLKETALPTIHLKPENINKDMSRPKHSNRTQRIEVRKNKVLLKELMEEKAAEIEPDLDQEVNIQSSMESELEIFKLQYKNAVQENDRLKQTLEEYRIKQLLLEHRIADLEAKLKNEEKCTRGKVKQLFSEVFTKNQIEIILKEKSKARWTAAEISKAFTIRFLSKRCYLYFKNVLKYPLPGISTLQHWAANINLQSGILHDVLKIMDIAGTTKSNLERITVLSFDEVKVCSIYEYDRRADEVVGPHSYMQVVMARGLIEAWKQPVFIGFDTNMTKNILNNIILELHKINYTVVACVSDCGIGNQMLWKSLNINISNTKFEHPATKDPIYVFADVPHLVKLIRNWLLDKGFVLSNGKTINAAPLKMLIECSDTEINSCHKLTAQNVSCEGIQRQNVMLATQLLSHTTATALRRYFHDSEMNQSAQELADFIELVNDWFDIMNSRFLLEVFPKKQAFGLQLDEQNKILVSTIELFKSMLCVGKNKLQIFQKGVLISSMSLKELYSSLKLKHKDFKFILTHRLNQDCLENFFSQLRTQGGLHDHPAPLNALHRIRMILIGKNPGMMQANTNTYVERTEEYIVASAFKKAQLKNILLTEDSENEFVPQTHTLPEITTKAQEIKASTEEDGLEYIAGYLAKKLKLEFSHLGSATCKSGFKFHDYAVPSWVQHLSFGGLIEPSDKWMSDVKSMERLFQAFHGQNIIKEKNVILKTTKFIKMNCNDIEEKLIQIFVRQRLYMRLKYLNQKKSHNKRGGSNVRESKIVKKMTKIIT